MSKHKDNKPGNEKRPNVSQDHPNQQYKLVPIDHLEEMDQVDDIDVIGLLKAVWENRKSIFRFVIIGSVIGVFVVLISPKEYVSSVMLMPEYSNDSGKGSTSSLIEQYGGLIGLSGGSYSSNSNAIRVDLYPEIVQSLTFQKNLADHEFYYPDYDTTTSLITYFTTVKPRGFLGTIRAYTIGLPNRIGSLFIKNRVEYSVEDIVLENQILSLSESETEFIGVLRGRVGASLDDDTGIIFISARMGNPILAANVAKFTVDELTKYLIEYRTEKLVRDLTFIEDNLEQVGVRFQQAQLTLAEFEDSNQGSLTAKASTERQRLQSEYDIAFNLYNNLTQQFEEAKLKVQEETPLFKILQPVFIPVNDEMSGVTVLLVCVLLSIIAGIGWILIQTIFDTNFLEKQTDNA